jgi:acetyl esterase
MPLDPLVQQWLSQSADLPPINRLSVDQARKDMLSSSQKMKPMRDVLSVRNLMATGPDGVSIPLRHYAPTSEKAGVLIYFHGGGWVVGSRDSHDAYCRDLATHSGRHVVSVEYRMAPENPFPAAAEDCYHGTVWVANHLDAVQGKADELFVAGDSAGGNLAAVTCLLARERQGPKIDGQILVYPITDCDFDTSSYLENSTDLHLTREMMIWFWDQYVSNKSERSHWMASPLRAPDLSGLPAAFVVTAEFDPLRDEGEAYAERLAAAGVPTRWRRYDGMIHGFVRRTEWALAREALQDCAAAIQDIADGKLK